MKSIYVVLFCLSFQFLIGCAPKSGASGAAKIGNSKEAEPGQVSVVKTPARIMEEGSTEPQAGEGLFLANIRILTDTKSTDCNTAVSKRERKSEAFISPEKDFLGNALFNVQLKSTGFDESSYQFSEVERKAGKEAPRQNPYGLKLRWRGAARVEIQFLDHIQKIQLDSTPILSFQATEKRDGCSVDHQVNLFADDWKILRQ